MSIDELIERLEKATGASRELDGEIACLTDNAVQVEVTGLKDVLFKPASQHGTLRTDPLPYTSSIDAALTLVPEGCAYELRRPLGQCVGATVYGHNIHADADAATPALALCIAALRAQRATHEQ